MKLFDIISLADSSIEPDQCKVHLACWNGKKDVASNLSDHDTKRDTQDVVSDLFFGNN